MRLFRRAAAPPAPPAPPPTAPEGRPRLTFPAGGSARHGTPAATGEAGEVVLPGGRFVIGRGKDCDLRLDDPTVSPRHLALEVGEKVVLRDVGSLNGTLVDGVPALQVNLVDGNRIELGETTLLFGRDAIDDDGGRQGGEGSPSR
ncbi:MAG: FHA domain-containing protein [Mycobacteriales bacterium]